MLEVKNITVRRGKRAVLENVSLTLPRGQVTGVLGLNGAGKTTLISAIMGFCPLAGGSVSVAGRPLRRMPARERARLVSFVPQSQRGDVRFPVEDFVSMGATAYLRRFSRPGRVEIEKAGSILEGLGCGHLIGRAMDRISGGERRMACLARAVMQAAPWLLLDEPVASLDFSRQHSFLWALREYVREQDAGCLLTIHDPALAYDTCDRLVLLHEGRVLADAAVAGEDGEKEKLAAALRAVYGPRVSVAFRDGGLVMKWGQNNF